MIYQLVLTYNFHINKTTEVTIISPLLSEYLYESDFESQIWMLYDSNNKYIMTGDAYPEKVNKIIIVSQNLKKKLIFILIFFTIFEIV